MQDSSPYRRLHHARGARATGLVRFGLTLLLVLCSAMTLFSFPLRDVCGHTDPGHPRRPEILVEPAPPRTRVRFLDPATGVIPETGDSRPNFVRPDQDPQPLYVIGKISIDQRNVFDESDSSLFRLVGSVANSVHVLTDEDVIRRELLFKEGDLYDQRSVDESGQNLRRLGIVGDVAIVCDTMLDNSIDITVKTRDRWTLRPGVGMRQDGDRGGVAVTVRDDNFMGNAQQLKLGYTYMSGPGSPHGGEFAFTEPRLWGSRWSMSTRYTVTQIFRGGGFSVECPFYSDRTPWAARFSTEISHTRFMQFRNGTVTDQGYINQENEMVWVASASQSTPVLEVAGAYYRMRTRAMGLQPRAFENADFVIGSVSLLSRKYVTTSSADFADRVEDVPLGYQAGIAFGRNLHFEKSGGVDYFGKVYAQRNISFGGKFLISYQVMATTYFDRWTPRETIVSGVALHNVKFSPNVNFIVRFAAVTGSRLDPTTLYILGSSAGLRGYRAFEFGGQKLLLVNLEQRVLSLMRLWFVRLGGALFFDSGAMCGQDESLQKQRFHSSAGFGLRINVGTGVIRMDWAYNLDQRRISLGISANQLFRVFAPLDFLSPVPEQPLR